MLESEDLIEASTVRESNLLRTSVVEDDSGQPVEIMDLEPALQILGHIPSPLQFLQALRSSGWRLDLRWQSASYIHKVIRDLHTRQHFSKLVLIYCKALEVVIVAGEEQHPSGPPRAKKASLDVQAPLLYVDQTGQTTDGDTDLIEPSAQMSEAVSTVPENLPRMISFILPGNSRMATINGKFRRDLDQELRKLSLLLVRLGRNTSPGWIIAITDAEEVVYYVEKQVSLDALKTKVDGETRDDVLSKMFGKNRVVNWRTAARKEERKAYLKAKEERLRRREVGAADQKPIPSTSNSLLPFPLLVVLL